MHEFVCKRSSSCIRIIVMAGASAEHNAHYMIFPNEIVGTCFVVMRLSIVTPICIYQLVSTLLSALVKLRVAVMPLDPAQLYRE
jgi:hypothetical protein